MNTFETIKSRRSIRKYKSTAIEEEKLNKVLEALQLAPTACNFQPFKFIVVKDKKVKNALVPVCRDQKFIAEAPIVIVGCTYPENAYQKMGGKGNSHEVDLAIAFDHLTLAAWELGLGTCWIGAFSEEEVKKVLGIPSPVRVVALTPLGYPDEKPQLRRRKSMKELIEYV
ncbi:MAG: nitroreductase family protein [Candidatus Omnitrophica bacterium]|nr:nitroreductase family protein [Candidatus Omnitrophota bacterium]